MQWVRGQVPAGHAQAHRVDRYQRRYLAHPVLREQSVSPDGRICQTQGGTLTSMAESQTCFFKDRKNRYQGRYPAHPAERFGVRVLHLYCGEIWCEGTESLIFFLLGLVELLVGGCVISTILQRDLV